jgi:hypothetical protein
MTVKGVPVRVIGCPTLPQLMAQYYNAVRAGAVFFRSESAPVKRRDAHNIEEACGEAIANDQLGVAHSRKAVLHVS